jgi:hypothetical protein
MRNELIFLILIVVANGAVALWKKWKEAQAAAAERAASTGGMRASVPARPAPPRATARPAAIKVTPAPRRRVDVPASNAPAVRAPAAAPARPAAPVVVVPRATPAAAVAAATRRTAIANFDPRSLLRDRNALRQAFLLREILGPPRGDQPLA